MSAELYTPEDNAFRQPEDVDQQAEPGLEIQLAQPDRDEARRASVRPNPPNSRPSRGAGAG